MGLIQVFKSSQYKFKLKAFFGISFNVNEWCKCLPEVYVLFSAEIRSQEELLVDGHGPKIFKCGSQTVLPEGSCGDQKIGLG